MNDRSSSIGGADLQSDQRKLEMKCERGHSDDRTCRELLFQIVVLRLARRQPEPPAVVMDHQGDMVDDRQR